MICWKPLRALLTAEKPIVAAEPVVKQETPAPVPTATIYNFREPANTCIGSTVKCYIVFYPKFKNLVKKQDCIDTLTALAKSNCEANKCVFYESKTRCECFEFCCDVPVNMSINKFVREIRVAYNKQASNASKMIVPKFIVSSTEFTDEDITKNI